MRLKLFFLSVVMLGLAACGLNDDGTVFDDPVQATDIPATQSPSPLQLPSFTPAGNSTATPDPRIVTAEPITPQPELVLLPNTVAGAYPGAWRTASFTDTTGVTYTLEDFAGQAVVLQTFALDCTGCADQTRALRRASLVMMDVAEQVVFISLSINPNTNVENLIAFQQAETINSFGYPQWIVAYPSQSLLNDLQTAFGEVVISGTSSGMVFITPEGTGYLGTFGVMDDITVDFLARTLLGIAPTPIPTAADNPE